jgi:hypothetical protein
VAIESVDRSRLCISSILIALPGIALCCQRNSSTARIIRNPQYIAASFHPNFTSPLPSRCVKCNTLCRHGDRLQRSYINPVSHLFDPIISHTKYPSPAICLNCAQNGQYIYKAHPFSAMQSLPTNARFVVYTPTPSTAYIPFSLNQPPSHRTKSTFYVLPWPKQSSIHSQVAVVSPSPISPICLTNESPSPHSKQAEAADIPSSTPVLISLDDTRSTWVHGRTLDSGVLSDSGVKSWKVEWRGAHGRRILSGFTAQKGNIILWSETAEEQLRQEGKEVDRGRGK